LDAGETAVRVLIVSSRYPWPPYSGDRLRTAMWVEALEGVAEVTLVVPKGAGDPAERDGAPQRTIVHPRMAVPNVFAALRRGLPLHTLMAATHDWRGAIAGAGEFDAAVVVLSRLDPWVGALPARWTILDAIDSLAHSMEERAREASPLVRPFWQREARAMAALERDAARRYDRVLVVNGDETPWFDGRAIASPIGVTIRPADPDRPRRYDFGFWGRIAYFANREAALHLANDVWPRIRAALPSASLVIAGADAPREIRQWNGRSGITVLSPTPDITELARDVRIGLFPIHFGTGQLTKILEAAEAGCAIVASPRAMRGLAPLEPHAIVCDDAAGFASAALDLHGDGPRARELGRGVRAAVESNFSRTEMKKKLIAIVREGSGT
jgi:glycosyltransferase involved in cell wall biosynthesis